MLLFEIGFRLFHDFDVIQPRMVVFAGHREPWCCPPLVERFDTWVFAPDIEFQHCYASDYRGYFDANNCVGYALNSSGFRDREHSFENPERRFRVVVLGDSFSLGEGVRADKSFFGRLERTDRTIARRPVEWINLAVSGGGVDTHTKVFEQLGVRYAPDLVILQWNTNDVEDPAVDADHRNRIGAEYAEIVERAREIGWSRLAQYLWFSHKRASIARRLVEVRVDPGFTRANFRQIDALRDRVVAADSDFRVLIFPELADFEHYPYQKVVADLEAHLRSVGIAFTNALPALSRQRAADLWVHPSDHHPNDLAHEVVYERLAAELLDP